MSISKNFWMKYTISLYKKEPRKGFIVGSALVSNDNKLLCYSYTGEKGKKSWVDGIITALCQILLIEFYNILKEYQATK